MFGFARQALIAACHSHEGIVKLSEVGAVANHISLMRRICPGCSRERIASNPGLIAQLDNALGRPSGSCLRSASSDSTFGPVVI